MYRSIPPSDKYLSVSLSDKYLSVSHNDRYNICNNFSGDYPSIQVTHTTLSTNTATK